MAYYSIPLKAGVAHVQEVPGSLILVDGIDGAAGVDVTPIVNGSRQVTMPGRKSGFKYRTQFDAVELSAAADCQVRIFLTTNDVTLGFTDGAQVNVLGAVQVTNGTDQRLPVDLSGGTVNVTANNVGISNDNSKAVPTKPKALATIVNLPAVTVGTAAAQLVADATLERLHVRNGSDTQVIALGGPTVTLANAAVVLYPGETMIEDQAAGATWYAISDAAGATAFVMGVKS